YDTLNRITAAVQDDGAFSQMFQVDAWGNLRKSGTSSFLPQFDTKNRPYDPDNALRYQFDAAGNMTVDDGVAYTYDPENRIDTFNGSAAKYFYDDDGQRIRKELSANDWTEYIYFGGQIVSEQKPNGAMVDYIYANGKRIAKADT